MVGSPDQAERGDGGGDDRTSGHEPRRADTTSPGNESLPERQLGRTFRQPIAGNDLHPYRAGLNAGIDRAGSVRRRRRRRAPAFVSRDLAVSGTHRTSPSNFLATIRGLSAPPQVTGQPRAGTSGIGAGLPANPLPPDNSGAGPIQLNSQDRTDRFARAATDDDRAAAVPVRRRGSRRRATRSRCRATPSRPPSSGVRPP